MDRKQKPTGTNGVLDSDSEDSGVLDSDSADEDERLEFKNMGTPSTSPSVDGSDPSPLTSQDSVECSSPDTDSEPSRNPKSSEECEKDCDCDSEECDSEECEKDNGNDG